MNVVSNTDTAQAFFIPLANETRKAPETTIESASIVEFWSARAKPAAQLA